MINKQISKEILCRAFVNWNIFCFVFFLKKIQTNVNSINNGFLAKHYDCFPNLIYSITDYLAEWLFLQFLPYNVTHLFATTRAAIIFQIFWPSPEFCLLILYFTLRIIFPYLSYLVFIQFFWQMHRLTVWAWLFHSGIECVCCWCNYFIHYWEIYSRIWTFFPYMFLFFVSVIFL